MNHDGLSLKGSHRSKRIISKTKRNSQSWRERAFRETSVLDSEYNSIQRSPSAVRLIFQEPHVMRSLRYLLAGLVLSVLVHVGRADGPPDPLRLVPNEADLFLKIERPRKIIETGLNLDAFKQLRELEAVQEVYDSTNFRRLYQLVGYYEKELGTSWPEILDKVAGGGIVLSAKVGPDPAPLLAVIQGTDEAFFQRFLKVSLDIIGQELARQGAKQELIQGKYHDFETISIGKDLRAGVAGSALLISNREDALKRGLDLYKSDGKKSLAQSALVADARRLLPKDPLAWVWFNLEVAHKAPQAKDIFKRPRNDPILTVLFGGLLDVIGRAPFVSAALAQENDQLLATVRLPRGLEGMAAELATHVPSASQLAPRSLLEPKGVLLSESVYFDPGKFWEKRKELFNDKQVKTFEDFDKKSALFLLGNRFNQVVTKIGTRHRFVAVNQPQCGYPIKPDQPIPAFALILEMRDPSLGKSAEAMVRGAALLAGTQIKLKLTEEKQDDVNILGYRFLEGSKIRINSRNFVNNFSPCMAVVGDQLVACSTLELCHEIVGLLQKETPDAKTKGPGASVYTRLYPQGGAQALEAARDQLVAQTILNQAVTPDDAGRQVQMLIDWVRHLGPLEAISIYGTHDFRYDIKWTLPSRELQKEAKR
jgi:hypothetical protein